MRSLSTYKRLDQLGIGVAIACAVHCALLPFVITVLPLLGLGFLAHPALELSILLISLTVGLTSIGKSWKLHRRFLPIFLLLGGFTLIYSGHFLANDHDEWIWLTAGSTLVAVSHLINWYSSRQFICKTSVTSHD